MLIYYSLQVEFNSVGKSLVRGQFHQWLLTSIYSVERLSPLFNRTADRPWAFELVSSVLWLRSPKGFVQFQEYRPQLPKLRRFWWNSVPKPRCTQSRTIPRTRFDNRATLGAGLDNRNWAIHQIVGSSDSMASWPNLRGTRLHST